MLKTIGCGFWNEIRVLATQRLYARRNKFFWLWKRTTLFLSARLGNANPDLLPGLLSVIPSGFGLKAQV
jgi:hypothetical protein